ncbi:putative capsular associated protein [Aspergillus lucknowensis]|uniref:Glycosyl transferase CAP10 domain-containing protein n=1 Tax=Aspergillus lucknowensis TaxID=176173 RepID=A0ABR4LH60_9EURO
MIRLSVENGLRALVGAFLLSCTFITTSYNTTFAFDHPLHTAVLACFLSGISLVILSRFVDRIPHIPLPTDKYSAIPLTELDITAECDHELPHTPERPPLRWWLKVGILSGISCARIALYRSATDNIECAPTGHAFLVPLFVAIYDLWRNQRATGNWARPNSQHNAVIRAFITIASGVRFFVLQSRLRYIVSTAFLAMSGFLAAPFSTESTFICPIVSGQRVRQRTLNYLSLILDSLILAGAAELSSEGGRSREGRKKQAVLSWGYGLLGVALFWIAWVIHLTVKAEGGTFVTSHYLRSAWCQAVLITIVITSASQLVPQYGIVGLCVLGAFIANFFSLLSTLVHGQEPFPLIPASYACVTLAFCCIGGFVFLLSRAASDEEPQFLQRLNLVLRFIIVIMFGIGVFWVFSLSSVCHLHPIELLIHEAGKNHDTWLRAARESSNLAEAVQQYQKKYKQQPPPNFDKWYDYAVSRSSVTIDEFDEIYTNLLPYRALTPAQLREMTQKLATNPLNDIGALAIRNGTVRVQEGIKPTHAWMVQSAGRTIEKFSEHLPDMDLAFNLNDEPRVVVPWTKMVELQNQARVPPAPSDGEILNGWSTDRDATWAPLEPPDQTQETMFTDRSFQKIFDPYIAPACPPGSKARSQRIWSKHKLCIGCIRPHSMGQFPTDVGVSTDVCHQPDLADLHGLFLSPASFKVTQELVPVFSQSSVSVFNDIIFPSPWNYVDKIGYGPSEEHRDPKYTDKENSLFWIGSTTEGISHDGRWKGMPRQRLAHLVNNNTHNHVSILLPAEEPKTYSYQIFNGHAPTQELGLNASVSITDPIVRCWGKDCTDQEDELSVRDRIDFQDHWKYRYLFDSDGAGFSGRFLPFLQSRSIPFKTGLFKQWLDSRITPWLHYAPIDIRLHGLWSTLAYFGGVDATVDGDHKIEMKSHDMQGQRIAEEGRRWAEKALRKEDMEIYFFRLLLEWGRLTDDRRDSLGFKLDS